MRIAASFALITALGLGTATAERGRGAVQWLPNTQPRPAGVLPHEPTSRIIFLHRCPEQGCVVFVGQNDSRANTSSAVGSTATIGPYTRGDAAWQKLVDCVRATYAPFDVEVTDIDPGPNVEHFENIVGGRVANLNNPDFVDGPNGTILGLAPATCGEVPNAISFTFDVLSDPIATCATAAQETGHAFGLEHEYNAKDPMTYLDGPLPKRFQATDSPCGEYSALPSCRCTGAPTQNTYEHLLALFGPGAATPPSISIKSPTSGKRVQPGFTTRVDAKDDVAVGRVELLIDDEIVAESMTEPFDLVAPDTIAEGPHTLTARAFDVQGALGESDPLEIVMGPPCTAGSGCEGSDVCVMGVCIPGPDAAGGIGGFCQADSECLSRQCLKDSTGESQCVAACDLATPGACPNDFECIAAGGGDGVCWYVGGGGCCDAGGRGGPGAMLLGLGVFAIVFRRRRAA